MARLVVGYDGSNCANAAAAFGLWLAGKVGCQAIVVNAGPTPETAPSADLLPAAAEQVVAYEREWQSRLENLREYAAEDAVVECRVVRGSPAGVLIAAAVDSGADMILTGSHGVGRVRGALLGSVSSQVLAHAPCSVMVFREHGRSAPAAHARTVVIGIDGSDSSRHALELGQALAALLGAALVLVHAYDPRVPFVSAPTGAMRQAVRRDAVTVLHEARQTVAAPLEVIEEAVVEAGARDALVTASERHAPALLVVGSRGLGGFKELLLGSTSRWVVNHAPCPVLVARRSALAR
ncbi:MAG TPA: universal stress protein [Solirubrobacteraceae bacterium]|nr:universal stress protein [Solirubrobacteraceae bacterium]